jgi:FtsP/CotA-like multicopper oxidase with cupredoxin domain
MTIFSDPVPTRRTFLITGASAALTVGVPQGLRPAYAAPELQLVAERARVQLAPPPYPQTAVWCYNGKIPGPSIRAKQGERLRIVVENRLAEATTVHWHGIRVPNAMDGVPDLTQKPIAPGQRFVYEFDVPDAGTYWYHPHQRSFEQVGRGLYGALIVEERNPIQVDRDVTWLLRDWRLEGDAQISNDFGSRMEISMAGRIGNTVTVNDSMLETFAVRSGERVRLRLINAAPARIFGLVFGGHRPVVIAYDGQPVEPHEAEGGRVVIGPAMRVDVVIDMTGKTGERFTVKDDFYQRYEYRLLDLVYEGKPLRDRPLDAQIALAANTMPEPDLKNATRHEVTFDGGMMSGKGSGMMGMMGGMAWAINGVAGHEHAMEPLLTLERGRSYVLAIHNDTAWYHPTHLHGHSFRVISRNGEPTRYREWQDTVLLAKRERAEIAFVADNPGDWMFHCHVLEHQEGGMMGVIRVT